MPQAGIRTRGPSNHAAADLRFRPRRHWDRFDRPSLNSVLLFFSFCVSPSPNPFFSLFFSHCLPSVVTYFSFQYSGSKKFRKWFCNWNALPFRRQHDKEQFSTVQTARLLGCFAGARNAWHMIMKNEKGVNKTGTWGLLQLRSATVCPFSLKCCRGLWRSSRGYRPCFSQVATH